MIRIEALRVFVTVADCGNIKEAAERLFRTQSAISMTLKQIESHLGAPLFETDRKHSLTDLGRYVQGVATLLLRDHDQAIGLIEGYARGQIGRLRIASVPSVATRLIPVILRAFVKSFPAAEIDLVDTDSSNIRHLVEAGALDLGVGSLPAPGPHLTFTPLFEDRLHLVFRADSDLARLPQPLTWEALGDATLIMNETSRDLQAPGFQALAARASLSVRNVASLLAMVEAGMGVTLLPGLATLSLPPGLAAAALADPSCSRKVGIIQRAGRVQSPLANAFCRHLTGAIDELSLRFQLQKLPVA
ncbi:MAG: LysR family transcriptional regulator [Paracoccaceae bacterium]